MGSLSVIRLSPEYGVKMILCGNPEVVCDDSRYEADFTTKVMVTSDACSAAMREMRCQLGATPDVDSTYAHWRGGQYGFADVAGQFVAAYLFRFDEDERRWEWVGKEGFPADLTNRVREVVDKMDAIITKAVS